MTALGGSESRAKCRPEYQSSARAVSELHSSLLGFQLDPARHERLEMDTSS